MLISHVAAGVAKAMHCHALRFDFRGNGSSGGTWHSAGYDNEFCDLERVVNFVRKELGCKVTCIVGHSKGSAAVLRFAQTQGKNGISCNGGGDGTCSPVPCFVNMAGRYVTPGDFDIKTRFTEKQCNKLEKEGQFTLKTFGEKKAIVTRQDIDERANFDSSFVAEISPNVSVFTIHGSADAVVPVNNATKYDKSIRNHTVMIIDGADHNFNGLKYMKEIVLRIVEFVEKRY